MRSWPTLEDRSGHPIVEGPLRRVTVVPPGQGVCKDVLVPGQVAGHKKNVVLPTPCPDVESAQGRGLGPALLVDIGNRGGVVGNDIHSSALQLRKEMLQG